MDTLPVEIVEYIFKYLVSIEDRKSASLVCQQWYRAYMSSYFRELEVVNITADKQLSIMPKLENTHRKYFNFVMKNVDITEDCLQFWERFGRHMKTLTFQSCYLRERMFVKALVNCPKLESLTFHDCKELLMSGLLLENYVDQELLKRSLSNLKSLCFIYSRYLSDAILIKVLALCPNITSLNLTGCQISYHNGMFKKFYPQGIIKVPSESVTTFQVILRYIASNAKRIKTLSFNDTFIDNVSLQNLSQIEKLELEVLKLRSCVQISNNGLIQLCGNLQTLTDLDVGLCPRITDTSFIVLCDSLPQLKKLSLQGCRAISDLGLANIWKLKQLQSLNLAECDMIQGEGIIRGLCHKTNYSLLELKLGHLGNITEAIVVAIAEFMPNIRHLDLGFCYNAVTDLSLQAVFEKCALLRVLNVAMCNRITDCGLTGMGVIDRPIHNSVVQLMKIPLGSKQETEIIRDAKIKKEVRIMCESEMLGAEKSGVSLSNLKGLQQLNIAGCNRVSDVSLKYAFRLTELKSLNLSHCQQISTEGLIHLVHNCPAIEDLDLDKCQNVDDDGVECVVKFLTRLKSLILGSNKITNTISTHIANNALQIRYIDIRHCSQVTGSEVGPLLNSLPFLQTFHYPETKADSIGVIPPLPPIGLWLRKS